MKHKRLRILSLLLLILIAAESGMIFHKILKKEESANTIPTIQAEGSRHQIDTKVTALKEATPEEAHSEKETEKIIPQSSQTEKKTDRKNRTESNDSVDRGENRWI